MSQFIRLVLSERGNQFEMRNGTDRMNDRSFSW